MTTENSSHASRGRVSEAVWPWKQAAPAAGTRSDFRPPWFRGGLQCLIMLAIGWVLFRFVEHRIMAFVVWGFAGVVLVSSVWIPGVFAAIEHFGQRLGRWVGTGLTYLLLVPFFYLVFVPGHVLLWLLGRDPMHRRFPSPEPTCWSLRRTRMDERHYRKQFS